MYKFTAYRWNDKTYINENSEYKTGEILTEILNFDIIELEKKYKKFKKKSYVDLLRFPLYDEVPDYNDNVWKSQNFFSYLDALAAEIPPYNKVIDTPNNNQLVELLNDYSLFFKTDDDGLDEEFSADEDMDFEYSDIDRNIDYEPEDEEKYSDKKIWYSRTRRGENFDYENYKIKTAIQEFEPYKDFDGLKSDAIAEEVMEFNLKLEKMFANYINFAEDLLRMHYVYKDFLDNYFHISNSYPNAYEVAERYEKYIEDVKYNPPRYIYQQFAPVNAGQALHTVLRITENKQILPILCEMIVYQDFGSFLNYELFDGMKTGDLPKKCGCCGKYFLPGSAYADFCERIAPNEKYKTCRDVGPRKKFDDKVKSDPVWLAYQRAYKAHYARYMKKKMTISEFEQWSAMAMELRKKALDKEIEFAEYERLIKE